MLKVLIIGSSGYLGTHLKNYLIHSKKYKVTGLDIGYFDDCYFKYSKNIIDYYKLDIRDVDEKFISNYDVVINLAGLSLFLINPLKDIDEEEAYKITENFTKNLAFICKKNDIKFIFPSSCSVYGRSIDTIVDEESKPNPITFYSKNKLIIENILLDMASNSFCPVVLRLATVFGFSQRMRFDIVVNMLTAMALTTNEIVLNSDGLAYRPHVEIEDVCRAFECSIDFQIKSKKMEIFNVGCNKNNIKIIDVANLIKNLIPNSEIKYIEDNIKLKKKLIIDKLQVTSKSDKRNYRVNFDKIRKEMNNYKCETSLEDGIKKLIHNLKLQNLNINDFENYKFHRLKKLNQLLGDGLIDNNLKWTI